MLMFLNIFSEQLKKTSSLSYFSFILSSNLCIYHKVSLQFLSDCVIEDLVRPLLAILDRPEKLLLLREIR